MHIYHEFSAECSCLELYLSINITFNVNTRDKRHFFFNAEYAVEYKAKRSWNKCALSDFARRILSRELAGGRVAR